MLYKGLIMKKIFKTLSAVLICAAILLGIGAAGFFVLYTPTLTADLSVKTGEVTNGASGYLYGLAEPGVPSKNMTESVDISTVSQKVTGGLQHPIGDISHVYGQLDQTDYIVVYLQDAYSTWYYEQSNIEKMRAENTYNWKAFITEDYFPKVEEAVKELSQTTYSGKIVYCLYNECDNGVWFGETKTSDDSEFGVYGDYNEVGEQNFFEAWKMTYDLVRSIDSDALIGGPGFCDYESDEIEHFLKYCTENDCAPQIMIYHELNDSSVYHWQSHVDDYRSLEAKYAVDDLPIIVTEYGRMQDNGLPGRMLQYITQIETSKVYGDNAYWRLANNLCDVAADDNSPNSNWWVYRWYTDMEGQTVSIKYHDLFKSNLGKAIKREAPLSSKGFMGLVTITDEEDKLEILCGGRDGSAVVKLKNIDATKLYGRKVKIKIEEVLYQGISGIVTSPVTLKAYHTTLDSKLVIDLNDLDEGNAYHITIVPSEDDTEYENTDYIHRYEFEKGDILGNAYTYSSAYATTGENDGMVGGMEQDGDGVSITLDMPEDGDYELNFIYGNSNDGEYDENGKQDPDDRTNSVASVEITIEGGTTSFDLTLPNTIKSEYTDCYTLPISLSKGKHTLTVRHKQGTIVLDSLLVTKSGTLQDISVLSDADRTDDETQSYLMVVAADGYYDISFADVVSSIFINDNEIAVNGGAVCAYLMRGLNYIEFKHSGAMQSSPAVSLAEDQTNTFVLSAADGRLSGGASVMTNRVAGCDYIDNISCNSGEADFTVTADSDGVYAMTITYANNDEGGVHAYNVDLIERYVTVNDGVTEQDVYCRNTYSWDTYKTVTAFVTLKKGENTITLSNSGNHKFDGADTYAPHISSFTINDIAR